MKYFLFKALGCIPISIIDNNLNELCEIVDEQASVEIITKQMHHKFTIS
jgi:hypothetical protein